MCTTATYQKSDGHCACGFYLEVGLTFQTASASCQSYGARVPEINSTKENNDIITLMVRDGFKSNRLFQ
jgi:hypothetical protein